MRMLIALLFLPALAGCGNSSSPEEQRQAALSKLEATAAMEHGDLIRARAECQAIAIEAPGALEDCLHALRIQTYIAERTLSDIEQRRRELAR